MLCYTLFIKISFDIQINSKYQQSNYSISILPDETLYVQTEDLLKELVSQRLAQVYIIDFISVFFNLCSYLFKIILIFL